MNDMPSKKDLSEQDICTRYITPALEQAGWDKMTQIRQEVTFTAGRIVARGKTIKRKASKRADYLLYHKNNIPIAVIEAKDNNHHVGDGMQQALDYAEVLDIPVAITSNGDGFLIHDKTQQRGQLEREVGLDNFPSPQELWERYKSYKGIETKSQEEIVQEDYYYDPAYKKTPRYYQRIAINRTIEAIAKGYNRLLLVMATGTGKTFTAFQICYRLWKSGRKNRILFLTDRNALIEQTKRKDFRPFGNQMTIIKNRRIDKAYEVYLSLYQQLVNYDDDEPDPYTRFSPDFFDLIIIDECHRGSAKADNEWRKILNYFQSATQIGMTATPKETEYVSNIEYFGKPIYTYSLKQGIEDGFLAPYKVLRLGINVDLEGWRPESGQTDRNGNPIEDRIYNQKDFEANLVIDERTQLVAKRVTEFLTATSRYDKTIIFCVDIEHAARMRQALVNENPDIAAHQSKYVMRITGDDADGKRELDNFTNPEEVYPVIATTSRLMTTGIDAETCKLIVIERPINSMTEFKQIIGRGTRINEEYEKYFFTIMDFRRATDHFADPKFDGEPVMVKEMSGEEEHDPEDYEDEEENEKGYEEGDEESEETEGVEEGGPNPEPEPEPQPREKVYVNGVDVSILNERTQYLDKNGKLITESLKDYTRRNIRENFESLDEFLAEWREADRKKAILDELEEQDILLDELRKEVPKELDIFDLICHVAWDKPPMTRKERANQVRKRDYFSRYGEQARKVLQRLLDKYADYGIESIEDINVLRVKPFDELGTPMEIIELFGSKEKYEEAVKELEEEIYKSTA